MYPAKVLMKYGFIDMQLITTTVIAYNEISIVNKSQMTKWWLLLQLTDLKYSRMNIQSSPSITTIVMTPQMMKAV